MVIAFIYNVASVSEWEYVYIIEINCMSTSTGGLFPLPLYTMAIYSVTSRIVCVGFPQ